MLDYVLGVLFMPALLQVFCCWYMLQKSCFYPFSKHTRKPKPYSLSSNFGQVSVHTILGRIIVYFKALG